MEPLADTQFLQRRTILESLRVAGITSIAIYGNNNGVVKLVEALKDIAGIDKVKWKKRDTWDMDDNWDDNWWDDDTWADDDQDNEQEAPKEPHNDSDKAAALPPPEPQDDVSSSPSSPLHKEGFSHHHTVARFFLMVILVGGLVVGLYYLSHQKVGPFVQGTKTFCVDLYSTTKDLCIKGFNITKECCLAGYNLAMEYCTAGHKDLNNFWKRLFSIQSGNKKVLDEEPATGERSPLLQRDHEMGSHIIPMSDVTIE